MRARLAFVFFSSLALGACSSKSPTLDSVSAQDRAVPLVPATRAVLAQARALDCSPSTPTVCTTTDPDCALTFDSEDQLTHLRCEVENLVFECTRPCGRLFVCTWSDAKGCADVYDAGGAFQGYLCGVGLQSLLAACGGGGGDACEKRDQASCQPPCVATYCKTCDGAVFTGCSAAGTVARCPEVVCPGCAGLDEQQCQASDRCHAVYRDDQICACAPAGCCTHFDRCAEGASARCSAPLILCDRVAPHCEGDFVVSYTESCYEGCVLKAECADAPLSCTPETFAAFKTVCGGPDGCTIGIHQTNCCGDHEALGISAGEKEGFYQLAAACDRQFPACECPTRGIATQDGKWVQEASSVGVACTAAGVCRTYAR